MTETAAQYIARMLCYVDGRDPLHVLERTADRMRVLLETTDAGAWRGGRPGSSAVALLLDLLRLNADRPERRYRLRQSSDRMHFRPGPLRPVGCRMCHPQFCC
jgi:hypothetical protein